MFAGHSDLPLDRDASGRFLPWIIALMVYLATLALGVAMILSDAAARWNADLSGTLTIEIAPSIPTADGNAADGDAADTLDARVADALAILRETPGVAAAERIDEAATAALLEPWLGSTAAVADLPIPALIDVTIVDRAAFDADALSEVLGARVPGAVVDDHAKWLADLLALARSIQVIALAIVVLIGTAAVLAVIFVARAGLAIHGHVVELLHMIGAPDGYIARQFQNHVGKVAIRGGAAGLALALATLGGLQLVANDLRSLLLPDPALSAAEWLVLLLVPAGAALIAGIAARWTVLRALARLP